MMPPAVAGIRDFVKRHPLGLALLSGLILRLVQIQGRELQYDDAFSMLLASRSLPEIISGTIADTMPPLYYFLLHYWLLLSGSVWFARLLSVLFGLALVAILFWTVSQWAGRAAGTWAAFLAAISPLQIYHSQDVRMYALLVLGQLGYAWFFTRIWFAEQEGQRRWADWAGLVFCGLVAMYSHNVGVFGLVAPNLFLLIQRRWKLLARLVSAQLAIGIGALPWLFFLPGQVAKIQNAVWLPRPGLVEIIQSVIMFTAAMPLPPVLLVIAAVLSFQILIIVVLETWRLYRHDAGAGFLTLLLLVPPALLFLVSYLVQSVFVTRVFLISSLAYYGLAGVIIARSWQRGPGKLVAGAFLVAAAISLPGYYTFDTFPRSPYREAAQFLAGEQAANAAIIHDNKLSFFPMHVYNPALKQTFVAGSSGSLNDTFAPASQQAMQIFPQPDLPTAAGSSPEIYFVTFSEIFQEYQSQGFEEHPGIQWLNDHYRLIDRRVFNDLEIYHYRR